MEFNVKANHDDLVELHDIPSFKITERWSKEDWNVTVHEDDVDRLYHLCEMFSIAVTML